MQYRILTNNIAKALLEVPSAIQDLTQAITLAKLLIEELTGLGVAQLLTKFILLEQNQETQLANWVLELKGGKPWQYVLGWAPFDGLRLSVGPSVLIPRPETEELVMLASQGLVNGPLNLLDLCTGSGCIAIALKNRFPQALVEGWDISAEALALAQQNAGLMDVKFSLQDVLTYQGALQPTYQLIISNPPYIKPSEAKLMASNVLDYEPHLALFTPEEDPLLFYTSIAQLGQNLLTNGGTLWLECNEAHTEDVLRLLVNLNYSNVKTYIDFRDKPRFVSGIR